jgi:chemosensory pili system protein ChpA (sensor histidine kinase/response regulator)
MSTHTKVDPTTLGWVKNEIDEALKQARLALEAFAENPGDKTRLRFCLTHLHQVVGTLLMVELDGAALLAREAEALAEALLNDQATDAEAALEALTRGILTLPEYLGRLQAGQPDVPLRQLPLVNEMRTARGVEPTREFDLFAPDLAVRPPRSGAARLSDADFAALARDLRPRYQNALLAWLRGGDATNSLSEIAAVMDDLQQATPQVFAEQLFWSAGGFVESLAGGGLEASAERKKLFARIDQQIKKFMDGAQRSAARKSSEELVRALLYEVGQTNAPGPRAMQLRRAFELDKLLAPSEGPACDLPSPEALASVSQALGKELETAQDLLTAYFDPQHRDEAALARLLELMHKMSGILDMLGVAPLKRLVDELRAVGEALQGGRLEASDSVSMPMAQALLLVESSMRDFQHSAETWQERITAAQNELHALVAPGDAPPPSGGIEVAEADLSEADFRQLAGVVGEEVGVNLGKIEEALESFAADNGDVEALREVPGLLNQIIGAMQILGQDRAATFVEETLAHIEAIQEGRVKADAAVLDGLAVSVGTIGAYVEGVRTGRTQLDGLIDSARREMRAALRHGGGRDPRALLRGVSALLEKWLAAPQAGAVADDLAADLEQVVQKARTAGQEKIERIAAEMNRVIGLVLDGTAEPSGDVTRTLRQSLDALIALGEKALTAPPPKPAARAPTPPAVDLVPPSPRPAAGARPAAEARARAPAAPMQIVAEDADPEIVEIFIEDARDVLGTIGKEYPAFRQNHENTAALLELRRGFHTIKGSGRMVGATEIAETAWTIENMLNRLRDGKIRFSPPILEVLEEAQAVLPLMVAQLEGGPAPDADVAALRARAEALARGESPDASTDEDVEPPGVPAARHEPQELAGASPTAAEAEGEEGDQDLPALDKVLLDIFVAEASGHLATLDRELTTCRERGACLVTDPLFRANHTLLGNARSLGIGMMADACHEMEKLLQALRNQQLPLESAQIDLLERLRVAVGEVVERVLAGKRSGGDLRRRFDEIAAAVHALASPLDGAEAPAARSAPMTAELPREVPPAPAPAPVAKAPSAAPPPAARAEAPPPGIVPPPAPVAPRPAAAVAEAGIRENIDPELLEVFQEEAVDILGTIDETLAQLRARPSERPPVFELKRALHTLKGGARMAGAMILGTLAHNTESLLTRVESGSVAPSGALLDLLDEAHDTLVTMLDSLREGRPVAVAQHLNARLLAVASGRPVPEIPVTPAVPPPAPVVAVEPEAPEAVVVTTPPPVALAEAVSAAHAGAGEERREEEAAAPAAWPEALERRGQIRVNTGLLNQLVNYAGEVSIARSRMEQQVYGFRDNMAELKRNITRFREQIRDLEIQSESQILYRTDAAGNVTGIGSDFDPLEFDRFTRLQQLSRQLAESLHDLSTIQGNLGLFVGEAETVLAQQARLNTDLQEGLMRTRMVGFGTIGGRLRHLVRTTAREIGKRVELELQGAEVELDRTVLERMVGPFEHMIRNSIDHGFEPPDIRVRSGKGAEGRITIAVAQEGSEIIIRFADDGAGLNIEAIRAKAVERGLLKKDANLSEDELIQFILVSGFSTASRVTHLSGRGVGMDVVHNEVKQLGGTMSVETGRGRGTTFAIRLPLTLSITQALMVHVADQQFAIPLAAVGNIIEFPVERLSELAVGQNPLLNFGDQIYPYMHLGQRLGMSCAPRNGKKVPVLIARTGTREIAIQVDALGGTREIVIKALGPQLAEIKGLSGATILGDGRVILILDVPGLWYREDALLVEHRAAPVRKAGAEERERPVVMVVDDSLTVRKVTGKHLQKRGVEVMTAKDGLDAWEQLRERAPDIMLVDIEMPRMDGYELTQRVRGDEKFRNIPIIMITSRAGAKHRQRALDLGVDVYMSKPYQEEELFQSIETLLASGRSR